MKITQLTTDQWTHYTETTFDNTVAGHPSSGLKSQAPPTNTEINKVPSLPNSTESGLQKFLTIQKLKSAIHTTH